MLDKKLHYCIDNQSELLKSCNGRTLVVIGTQAVGDFDNYDEAFSIP